MEELSYTKTTGTFRSAGDVYDVTYYVYTPKDPPKAILQISHGMCEYIERYEPFISFMCQNSILVCGNDHIGHGKSIGTEDDLGYFGHEGGDEAFAADLNELYNIMRKKYRRLPYILFGHSMGSFVCRDYIARFTDTVDGAIICGTSGINKMTGMGIRLASFLGKLRGERYRSKFLKNTAFKNYNSHFPGEGEVAWLTKDKAIRDAYEKDPLCSFNFTAYGYRDMLTLLKRISSPEWAATVPQALPVFIISGEDDPVGDYGKGVGEVRCMLEDAELCNISGKLYPGDRHEILNETDRDQVWSDILEWVLETAKGAIECRTLY